MAFDKLLGEIRAQRARRDITQADLAKAAGIHPATFSRRVVAPEHFTIDELLRIANALDIPITVIFGEVEVVSVEVFQPAHSVKSRRRIVHT